MAARVSGGPILQRRGNPYFVRSRCAGAAGSTQFVIPPVRSTKRVIGNCGSQSLGLY
jgi:hypothetical protein